MTAQRIAAHNKKGPAAFATGPFLIPNSNFSISCFLVHTAHAAGAARSAAGRFLLLLRNLGDEGFGRQQQRGDRRGVLQRRAHDLRRVDDASLDQILVGVGQRVEAFRLLHLAHLLHHDRALVAGVGGDPPHRLLDGALHDVDADLLIAAELQAVEHLRCANQRDAAAGDDPLFDRRLGRVHRVLDARLLLLHLGLGRRTDLDHRDAADQLGQPLLQLLAVVVRGGVLDLRANLLDAALDRLGVAAAFHDRRVVLVDRDLLGLAEVLDLDAFELEAEIFGDRLAVGQNRDVLEHRLAAIAEARRLDRGGLQRAAQLVDDQRRQRLTFDVFRDDQQRAAEPRHLLEHRQQILHRADLLLVDQDDRVLEDHFHALGIGDEVRRQVAAIELHAFDHFQRGLERARFLDRDHAVLADLVHRVGDDLADRLVVVGRDGADLRDHVAADRLGHALDLGGEGLDGLLDAALDVHRVRAGDDVLRALAVDRLGQHGGGGGAVARRVRRLAGDFTHHLGAHVLERILQVDFLRHRHAVLGDGRGAELLVEDDIAALRAQGDLYRIGQLVHAAQDRLAGLLAVHNLFCHRCRLLLLFLGVAVFNDSENFVFAHDEEFLTIELDLLSGILSEEDEVARLDVQRDALAVVLRLAVTGGDHLALLGFFLGGVGDDDPADLLLAFLDAGDDDAVVQRSDVHAVYSV